MPADVRSVLLDQEFLVPARPATHVTCDACHDDHIEEFTRIKNSKGAVSFPIYCPDAGWVDVPENRLRHPSGTQTGLRRGNKHSPGGTSKWGHAIDCAVRHRHEVTVGIALHPSPGKADHTKPTAEPEFLAMARNCCESSVTSVLVPATSLSLVTPFLRVPLQPECGLQYWWSTN
jgi:hypothetical protein